MVGWHLTPARRPTIVPYKSFLVCAQKEQRWTRIVANDLENVPLGTRTQTRVHSYVTSDACMHPRVRIRNHLNDFNQPTHPQRTTRPDRGVGRPPEPQVPAGARRARGGLCALPVRFGCFLGGSSSSRRLDLIGRFRPLIFTMLTHGSMIRIRTPMHSVFHTIAYARKLQPHRAIVWYVRTNPK